MSKNSKLVFWRQAFFSILIISLFSFIGAITITQITPTDAVFNTSNSSIKIEINFTTDYLNNLTWHWNGTNYTLFDNSLILFYNFDNRSSLSENQTYVVDLSMWNHNGTSSGLFSGVSFDSNGYNELAIKFNGTNGNYINSSKLFSNDSSNFTVSFWVKSTGGGKIYI